MEHLEPMDITRADDGTLSASLERTMHDAVAAAEAAPAIQPPLDVIGLWIKCFIPGYIPNQTVPVPNQPGATMLNPTLVPGCYSTDNRSFSNQYEAPARITGSAVVGLPQFSLNTICWCDYTVRFDCDDGTVTCRKQADASRILFTNLRGLPGRYAEVDVTAEAFNPCTFGSSLFGVVDFRGTIYIDAPTRQVLFRGYVEPWPAFEMYAVDGRSSDVRSGVRMFTKPPNPDAGPWNLFGSANQFQEGYVIL